MVDRLVSMSDPMDAVESNVEGLTLPCNYTWYFSGLLTPKDLKTLMRTPGAGASSNVLRCRRRSLAKLRKYSGLPLIYATPGEFSATLGACLQIVSAEKESLEGNFSIECRVNPVAFRDGPSHCFMSHRNGISLAGMKLPNAPFRFAADEYLIPIPKANWLLYNPVLFEEDLYAVVASFMSHTSITSPWLV